jgi:hypothetical protein
MVAPAQGIACRPPVGRVLSENFAVRNGVKFRAVFPIFGYQTLSSRQIFLAIWQTFGSMARFWEMTGHV